MKQDTFYFTLHSDLALQSVEVNGTSVKPVAYGSGEEMKPHLKRLGKPVDDGESREHMALYGLPVTGQESAGDTLELLFPTRESYSMRSAFRSSAVGRLQMKPLA